MPNWCSNSIVIKGDKHKIKKIKRVLESMNNRDDNMGVFQVLTGRDERLSETQYHDQGAWYYSNIDRWGCKWDINYEDSNINTESDDCITMLPKTAWSPPEGFCRLLSQQYGVDVQLKYSQPGCDFAGRFSILANGEEEGERYEYLEGLYKINIESFWMEIRNNLRYDFTEAESKVVEEWLLKFPYVDEQYKLALIELYEEVKKENQ